MSWKSNREAEERLCEKIAAVVRWTIAAIAAVGATIAAYIILN